MNFELLNRLAYEYILMVEVLRKKYTDRIIDQEKRIYLDRELFDELLSKKDFLTVSEKKKSWRNLGWISCDKDRARNTRKIWIKGKSYRKVVIEIEPYLELKELVSK